MNPSKPFFAGLIPDKPETSIYDLSDKDLQRIAGNTNCSRWARNTAQLVLSERAKESLQPVHPFAQR